MRITVTRVTNTLKPLIANLEAAPATIATKGANVVRSNVERGSDLARGFAKGASGPHGSNYFKRITGEMTDVLQGEFGPHAGGLPVGGGYRHGPPNRDVERAYDLIRDEFGDDAAEIMDDLL